MSAGYVGRVLNGGKINRVNRYSPPPPPPADRQGGLREREKEGEREKEAGRGRISCEESL